MLKKKKKNDNYYRKRRLWYMYFYFITFTFSMMTRRFYPKRTSGQAVVTGIVPWCVPSFLSHIGLSIPTYCSSVFIVCSYALALSASRLFGMERSLRVCTRWDLNPRNDLDRHADHLPSNRGRRPYPAPVVSVCLLTCHAWHRTCTYILWQVVPGTGPVYIFTCDTWRI